MGQETSKPFSIISEGGSCIRPRCRHILSPGKLRFSFHSRFTLDAPYQKGTQRNTKSQICEVEGKVWVIKIYCSVYVHIVWKGTLHMIIFSRNIYLKKQKQRQLDIDCYADNIRT